MTSALSASLYCQIAQGNQDYGRPSTLNNSTLFLLRLSTLYCIHALQANNVQCSSQVSSPAKSKMESSFNAPRNTVPRLLIKWVVGRTKFSRTLSNHCSSTELFSGWLAFKPYARANLKSCFPGRSLQASCWNDFVCRCSWILPHIRIRQFQPDAGLLNSTACTKLPWLSHNGLMLWENVGFPHQSPTILQEPAARL